MQPKPCITLVTESSPFCKIQSLTMYFGSWIFYKKHFIKEGPLAQDYLISSFQFNHEASGGHSRQDGAKHGPLWHRAVLLWNEGRAPQDIVHSQVCDTCPLLSRTNDGHAFQTVSPRVLQSVSQLCCLLCSVHIHRKRQNRENFLLVNWCNLLFSPAISMVGD